ncbi:reticulon-like protein B22 [Neltuma alba]|uniref:reticulon-like protein B22 n=1 Tax=Neltuma alba TaxID=207710 RepID=UPI0010A3658A|nr:reticulon-like protein B22 [Prosopis alba]
MQKEDVCSSFANGLHIFNLSNTPCLLLKNCFRVPVDPLEWQITQDTANNIVAWFVNTIGAAESVLRVAATGHDKRLFLKVFFCLYVLSALGRLALGATVANAGLYLFCLYMFMECSHSLSPCVDWFLGKRNDNGEEQDTM